MLNGSRNPYIAYIVKTYSNPTANLRQRNDYLFPETESFVIAIQDRVINTHTIRAQNLPTDSCTRCHACLETIQHVTSSCKSLVPTDYKHRHNQVTTIVYQYLTHKHQFIVKKVPYYKYKPATD